jgi:uncharacterized radical SAM superfamily Fe-S cluster-containing enzyme
VHIVHPDGRIIPFDTYNLFDRDERERMLQGIRGDSQRQQQQLAQLTVNGAPP